MKIKECNQQNRNWQEIPDHRHRILIAGGSGPEKTNDYLV